MGVGGGGAGFGAALEPHAAAASAQSTGASIGLIVGGHRLEQVREALAGPLATGRDVLARDLMRLVAAQHAPRDGLAVDPLGAGVEAGGGGGGGELLSGAGGGGGPGR